MGEHSYVTSLNLKYMEKTFGHRLTCLHLTLITLTTLLQITIDEIYPILPMISTRTIDSGRINFVQNWLISKLKTLITRWDPNTCPLITGTHSASICLILARVLKRLILSLDLQTFRLATYISQMELKMDGSGQVFRLNQLTLHTR